MHKQHDSYQNNSYKRNSERRDFLYNNVVFMCVFSAYWQSYLLQIL